eukprot:765862-Hanusia_phi.AAC.1
MTISRTDQIRDVCSCHGACRKPCVRAHASQSDRRLVCNVVKRERETGCGGWGEGVEGGREGQRGRERDREGQGGRVSACKHASAGGWAGVYVCARAEFELNQGSSWSSPPLCTCDVAVMVQVCARDCSNNPASSACNQVVAMREGV